MNTIMPVIINHSRPTCPGCGREESIKEVCNHCGYEYERSHGLWFYLSSIICAIIIIWLFFIIITWLMDFDDTNITLVQVIKNQCEWIKGLLNRIK